MQIEYEKREGERGVVMQRIMKRGERSVDSSMMCDSHRIRIEVEHIKSCNNGVLEYFWCDFSLPHHDLLKTTLSSSLSPLLPNGCILNQHHRRFTFCNTHQAIIEYIRCSRVGLRVLQTLCLKNGAKNMRQEEGI